MTEDHVNNIIRDLTKRGYGGNYFVQNFYLTKQTLTLSRAERLFDRTRLEPASIPVHFRNFEFAPGKV